MSHIAQFNIARARWDLDDPRIAEFTENVDRINALADRSAGFIWRMPDDDRLDAPAFPGDPRMTWTLSVWRDVDSLSHFVWNTVHRRFRERTAEWFEPLGAAYLALWPICEGCLPTGDEAQAMLSELRRTGPSARVFGVEALAQPVAA